MFEKLLSGTQTENNSQQQLTPPAAFKCELPSPFQIGLSVKSENITLVLRLISDGYLIEILELKSPG